MTEVLTLTMNPAVDVTTTADRIEPGGKIRCQTPIHEPGGGGINVARAIVALGGDVQAVYPAGGHTGRLLQHLVDDTGVPHRAVELDVVTRESWSVQESDSGDHYHLVFPGPELSEHHWSACREAVLPDEEIEYLVMSGSLPPGVPEGFYVDLAAAGAERGMRCVLDTSGKALDAALQRGGFYLIRANRHEFAQITDAPDDEDGWSLKRWSEALRERIEDGVAVCLIMTLGSEGALLVTADEAWHARSPDVAEKSAVGAGDSFVGAFVHELHRTESLRDALVKAVAAAAAAVTTAGTQLFDREDVDRLCERVQVTSPEA